MKKFFLFASAALVLASCSSEAEEAVIKPNETPEEEVFELTEIKLGGGAPTASAETRAAVPVDDWNDTPVGIFGVNENASAEDNVWNDIADRNNMGITEEKAVILLNELAYVATPATTGGAVTFDAGTIYFPRGNSKNFGYTFLGYYPYIDNDPTVSDNSIEVTGKFDGTQDIMAGQAASAPTISNTSPAVNNSIGYNAKYIRDYKTVNGSGSYPEIKIDFKHLTSKIDILLQQGSSYMNTMCDVYAAWFKVEENYTLTFAKANSGNGVTTSLAFSGTTPVNAYAIGGDDFDENKAYKQNDIVRHTENGVTGYWKFRNDRSGRWTGGDVDEVNATPAEASATTPYTIFVNPEPVTNSGTATKKLYLVLKDDPSSPGIPVNVTSPAGGFEAGKAYKVTVTIHGPEEITVKASITDWVDGDPVDVEI